MVTKEEILTGIGNMDEWLPIYKIEEKLKMPKSTLQKFLKGERELPLKWNKPLVDYFKINPVRLIDANKQTQGIKNLTENNPKTNFTIGTKNISSSNLDDMEKLFQETLSQIKKDKK